MSTIPFRESAPNQFQHVSEFRFACREDGTAASSFGEPS